MSYGGCCPQRIGDHHAVQSNVHRCDIRQRQRGVDGPGYGIFVLEPLISPGYSPTHSRGERNGIAQAGALVDGLHAIGAKRVSIIAPYMLPLTRLVIDYIESEGIEVIDSISLEIHDNLAVGALDPRAPAELWRQLNVKGADAIVASACVQMPSLAAVPMIEAASGLPVVSSAVCTTYALLKSMGLERRVPGAGTLLSGRY